MFVIVDLPTNLLYEFIIFIYERLPKDRPDLSSERADPSVTALARTSSYTKLQTRPLVREGATT
jgi:hypothetical protein